MKLMKFEAEWCSGCKAQDTVLKQLEIPVIHVDVDEDPEPAVKYGIRSLPTMILFDDNDNEMKRFVGVTTLETLNQEINK